MPNCYYYDEQRNRCNCYVNKNLNELLAENARLREEIEAAKHDLQVFSCGAVELNAENAKLRELLQKTWDAFHDATAREFVTVKNELRELGVEVDE